MRTGARSAQRSRIDQLDLARWAVGLMFALGLVVSQPWHVPPHNPSIPRLRAVPVTASVTGTHCLDQPGGHFILCSQPVTFHDANGRQQVAHLTVTEPDVKDAGGELAAVYDSRRPAVVTLAHNPGLQWYVLAAGVTTGLTLVVAFVGGLALTAALSPVLRVQPYAPFKRVDTSSG